MAEGEFCLQMLLLSLLVPRTVHLLLQTRNVRHVVANQGLRCCLGGEDLVIHLCTNKLVMRIRVIKGIEWFALEVALLARLVQKVSLLNLLELHHESNEVCASVAVTIIRSYVKIDPFFILVWPEQPVAQLTYHRYFLAQGALSLDNLVESFN